MERKKQDVDVIMDVLRASVQVYPESTFVQSLLFQYQERGGLSKKQLEGLLQKAKKITTLPPARLATLEAIIKKKVTRQRSELPKPTPLFVIDEHAIQMVMEILSKYPQHKRVLFYKARLDNKETLSPLEKSELEKFHKLLVK